MPHIVLQNNPKAETFSSNMLWVDYQQIAAKCFESELEWISYWSKNLQVLFGLYLA